MHDYQTGFLVYSPEGAAYRIRYLCVMPTNASGRLGQIGHDFVRDHFLLTRQLRDYLTTVLLLEKPEGQILVA